MCCRMRRLRTACIGCSASKARTPQVSSRGQSFEWLDGVGVEGPERLEDGPPERSRPHFRLFGRCVGALPVGTTAERLGGALRFSNCSLPMLSAAPTRRPPADRPRWRLSPIAVQEQSRRGIDVPSQGPLLARLYGTLWPRDSSLVVGVDDPNFRPGPTHRPKAPRRCRQVQPVESTCRRAVRATRDTWTGLEHRRAVRWTSERLSGRSRVGSASGILISQRSCSPHDASQQPRVERVRQGTFSRLLLPNQSREELRELVGGGAG
jgi:hypothetical protein